ncbi:penicillin-binding transpeptidase domain-containing protein [Peptococcaceae bacterium 1198_IL3148]
MEFLRKKRIVQTFYLFLILLIPIMAKLIDVQIYHGSEYAHKALEQRSIKVVLEDIPRGDILDRNLKSLTGSGLQNKIVVFPTIMDNPQQVADQLAAVLKVSASEVLKEFANGSGILPYNPNIEQISTITAQQWDGVMVLPVQYRYQREPMAAHLIGHLGSIPSQEVLEQLAVETNKSYQLGDLIGKMGLEKYYETELKSTKPERLIRTFTDAAGTMLAGMGMKLEINQPDPGRQHLVTTIDYNIQSTVEKVMDKHIQQGAVVVMDVNTGDVVAMASRPNYNPANVSNVLATASADTFIDHCTSLYQPGSIFKLVVAAAALEEGIVSLDSTFVCLGEHAELVNCWHHSGHGPITFDQAFAQSCNPVFAELALKLGPEKIIEYAKKLGLDKQIIIGYPIPPDRRQNLKLIAEPYNLVNSSIGQGPVLATPMQLTAMMNCIVNDGAYIPPRVVIGLQQTDGTITKRFAPGNSHRAISPQTVVQIKQLLTLVVKDGVGKKAAIADIGSAGKTGSAEVAGQQQVNAWFCGYAPVNNPRYVVTVLVEHGESGGETAAPVFKEIMEKTLAPASVD